MGSTQETLRAKNTLGTPGERPVIMGADSGFEMISRNLRRARESFFISMIREHFVQEITHHLWIRRMTWFTPSPSIERYRRNKSLRKS
jgi:hypothetical protein